MSEAAKKRNIGPDGVRIRAFLGGLFIIFALGLMPLLTVLGASVALRMVVFLPAWISTLSMLQAASGICVFHSMRGVCSTQMGTEPIEDDDRRRYFVRRAVPIHLQALGSALLLTLTLVALSILIPWRLPDIG